MLGRTRAKVLAAWSAGVLMVAGLGLATASAQARGPMGPRGMGPEGRGGWMAGRQGPGMDLPLRQLGLTETQQEQVRTILQSHREDARATAEKLRAAREALDAAMTAEALDEGAIRTAHKQLSLLLEDGAVERARVRAEVWQVLTPEQRAKATELKAQARQNRADRVERMKQRMEQRLKRQQERRPPAGV